jgi:hypothetical protein
LGEGGHLPPLTEGAAGEAVGLPRLSDEVIWEENVRDAAICSLIEACDRLDAVLQGLADVWWLRG